MYAVIHEIESTSTHGLVPIAGRPLVARQIQWLRSARCQGIAVQIGSSAESIALGQWLTRGDVIGTNVRLVMSGKELTPREIARRAGFPDDAPLLAIPADVLCGGDLEAIGTHASPEGTLVSLPAPAALADVLDGSTVRMIGAPRESTVKTADAWGVRVRSLGDAFVIGVAVLEGRLSRPSENGALLHASERERGVWVSRGAFIDPTATIIAPVLLGVDTIICAGACVGPSVFLGDRSVIERGTRIHDSMVAPGTIVGKRLVLSGMSIDSRNTQDLFTGEHATIDETLLLAPRGKLHISNWPGRILAIVLLVFFLPIGFGMYATARLRREESIDERRRWFNRFTALIEVFCGRRTLIGLSDWTDELPAEISPALWWKSLAAPVGFIKIDAGIAPDKADVGTKLRARVYYMYEKDFLLDSLLVLRCLGRAILRYTQQSGKRGKEIGRPELTALS